MPEYDVIVVGAGPAGATAAFAASKAGYRTAIIERQNLHRPKVCGGLVTTPCAEIIQDTFGEDIATEAMVDPGIISVFLIPPTGLRNGFPRPNKKIFNISRERFDGWLTDRAIGVGTTAFGNTRVVGLEPDGEGLEIRTDGPRGLETLRCRFVIGADGVYSSVRRRLRPDEPNVLANVVQDYFACKGEFEPYFYIFFKKAVSPSYAYVIPKDGYAVLGTERIPGLQPDIDQGMAALREWLLREFRFRADELAYREGWSVPFGSVCYGQGSAILIGDAGGFCHPFTAEGILYGVQAGAMVPHLIARAETEARSLSSVFQEEFEPIGDLMVSFGDYVRNITDEGLELLVKEKRATLPQVFGWDSTRSIAYNLPQYVQPGAGG